MAEYLILIYESEEAYATASPEVFTSVMEAHNRFAEQVPELGGTLLGGKALQDTASATTIRDDIVTDGPFVETKEVLGGYYLIELPDRGPRPRPRARDREAVSGPIRWGRGAADPSL
jgi:hypothetical protein